MSKPILRDYVCDLYNVRILLFVGCKLDYVLDIIEEAYKLILFSKEDRAKWKDKAGMTYQCSEHIFLVWVRNTGDIETLHHENLHLTGAILAARGIIVTPDNDESLTYYATKWFITFLRDLKFSIKRKT